MWSSVPPLPTDWPTPFRKRSDPGVPPGSDPAGGRRVAPPSTQFPPATIPALPPGAADEETESPLQSAAFPAPGEETSPAAPPTASPGIERHCGLAGQPDSGRGLAE